MRILFLTTQFPWPVNSGGLVRTSSQLKIITSLSEVERVTLLSIAERNVTESERHSFTRAFPKIEVLPPVFHPIHLWDFPSHVPHVLLLRAFGAPYLAAKWDSKELRRALLEELRRGTYDVVYIDHLGLALYLDEIRANQPSIRIVLDQHNFESDIVKQYVNQKTSLRRVVLSAEWRASVGFEKKVLMNADAVIAISIDDAASFKRLAGISSHVVPIVFDFERKVRRPFDRPHFCYVGNLRWRPNVAGLDWLCREVWPKILSRIPDATLEIVGTGLKPDPHGNLQVPDAWKVPGVKTVGYVEDLESIYDGSTAFLSPIFGGSGIRVKLLEGFRAGLPVVTTPDGAFGLPLTDGKEALIAQTSDDFAHYAERVATDELLWNRLRECGYVYLEEQHSQEVAQRAMRKALGI